MGWILVVCCIPLVPLLAIELAIPLLRRLLARKAPSQQAAADGPYRDSPAPAIPVVPPSYLAKWARYRRLWWSFLLVWLAFPVAMVQLVPWLVRMTGSPEVGAALAAGWTLSVLVCGLRWVFFRCPRCDKWFRSPLQRVSRWNTSSAFTRHCHHCALPIYAPCDPELRLEK